MGRIYRRATARRDSIDHDVHLGQTAGPDTAERFLDSVRTSFEDLAAQPVIVAPLKLHSPALAGMCKWPVRGFRKDLVFCVPCPARFGSRSSPTG